LPIDYCNLIYFDNAASTPVLPEVIREMVPYLETHYGNPSSHHSLGFETSRAIEKARKHVANLVGSSPHQITFTSGGTEANNLAIKGGVSRAGINKDNKNTVLISSSIEHDSVLQPFNFLKTQGFNVKFLEVGRDGFVKLESLVDFLKKYNVMFVSVMLANNEVGTIQPIKELAKITHESSDALFHCDAIQAAGKISIDVNHLGVDFLSLSSHKIYGPKGVGALYSRDPDQLIPLIDGGGQEKSLRSGTENVYGIVGFGEACKIASANLLNDWTNVKGLRDHLVDRVLSTITKCSVNGSMIQRLPNNAHFSFPGAKGEDIIIKLNEFGIAVSTGAACSSNKARPSHVLKAMGLSLLEIEGSLRITLGYQNTLKEVEYVVTVLEKTIKELRRHSGFPIS
jgi:cysteine desulfurase